MWVSGPCGAAARGLEVLRELRGAGREGLSDDDRDAVERFVRPTPLLAAGLRALGMGATAMIDVSDGLAHALGLVAGESGVGIELTRIPVAAGASQRQALYGGEDFELVVTFPNHVDASSIEGFVRIGSCVASSGVWHAGEPVDMGGFEHRWEDGRESE